MQTLKSLIGFTLIYALLAALWCVCLVRKAVTV